MTVNTILQSKGTEVHSISPQATLDDVVRSLVEKNCGSLLVKDGESVVGIITERDILRTCADESRSLSEVHVFERMTTQIVTATSGDTLNSVMGTLTNSRIRHLPIIDDGQLVGLISIGDVVKAQHDQLSLENHYLKQYITKS